MEILENKVAVVSGSSQGIGKETAKLFASRGASVILLARNKSKLEGVIEELDSSLPSQRHGLIVADFSMPNTLDQALQDFLAKETRPIHILVNNTGGPAGGLIKDATPQEFINTFQQHLICNHILAQALIPGMINEKFGRIINVISTSVKQPLNGLGVSNTIRGAVANWSKTLANELGEFNITVNNVLPGATNTSRLSDIAASKASKTGHTVDQIFSSMAAQVPMQRIAEPDEVAKAIGFLASNEADYVNGINLPVDGGRTKSL